jgi:hypothetical protein
VCKLIFCIGDKESLKRKRKKNKTKNREDVERKKEERE